MLLPDPALLLRNLFSLQRRRPTIRPTTALLALLDVLPQPVYLLDRRSPRRHSPFREGGLLSGGDDPVPLAPRDELWRVRRQLRHGRPPTWVPGRSRRDGPLRLLRLPRRDGISVVAEHPPGPEMARFRSLCHVRGH